MMTITWARPINPDFLHNVEPDISRCHDSDMLTAYLVIFLLSYRYGYNV